MKKFLLYFTILLSMGILGVCGCGKNPDYNKVASETDNKEQITSIKIESTEQITTNAEIYNTITIDEAAMNLNEKLQDKDKHLRCEEVEFHNVDSENRCYYIFRCYNDFSDHRSTIAWYAVDVKTGECFNTNARTEWTIMQ